MRWGWPPDLAATPVRHRRLSRRQRAPQLRTQPERFPACSAWGWATWQWRRPGAPPLVPACLIMPPLCTHSWAVYPVNSRNRATEMNLDILLVITVLLAISQQHKATAQVRPQLIALPADATASCPCGSEGCPELPNCQLESPAPPQLPSACVCGSEGCPAPPDCQNESPALPQSPSGCICGTDGCPVLPNCLPAKPSVQLANCACGTEGCPAPPDCIEAAYAEQPLFSGPEPIQGRCRLPV